jgi:hypothetical protein
MLLGRCPRRATLSRSTRWAILFKQNCVTYAHVTSLLTCPLSMLHRAWQQDQCRRHAKGSNDATRNLQRRYILTPSFLVLAWCADPHATQMWCAAQSIQRHVRGHQARAMATARRRRLNRDRRTAVSTAIAPMHV